MQTRHKSSLAALVTFLIGIAALGIAWQQRFAIFDWWRLRGYQPPAAIASLAADTTMTDKGRHLFYVYYPQLADKLTFSEHCSIDEQSIVLGCYARQRGIYLYDVTDERLNGVEQVTAAHEMLHAAYDRLGSERQRIDNLTAQAFAHVTDERVRESIERYRQRDPSVVPNELHSILATEVRNLPTELEEYYKRYISNRARIVSFSEQYEAAFTERKRKVAEYDEQLKSLKDQIESQESELKVQKDDLRDERRRLDSLLAAKQYEEYNAAAAQYNAQVRSLNAGVSSLQAKISQYNQIVQARNAISLEAQELTKALDSRVQTEPTQ